MARIMRYVGVEVGSIPRFVLGNVFFGDLHLWTWVCNRCDFAFYDGSFFWMLRSDTRAFWMLYGRG